MVNLKGVVIKNLIAHVVTDMFRNTNPSSASFKTLAGIGVYISIVNRLVKEEPEKSTDVNSTARTEL